MPILAKEPDLYPDELLDRYLAGGIPDGTWWALYTRSRREKDLMRRLLSLEIPFYSPIIERRYRSPSGRARTSHTPLFPNYVFLCGDEEARQAALTTNCISRCVPVHDSTDLATDLKRIQRLIETGHPISPEPQIEKGQPVRVLTGPFASFQGTVIRRHNKRRLLVDVRFMQQGASVLLDHSELEPLLESAR